MHAYGTISIAVDEALKEAQLQPRDKWGEALARLYAMHLDLKKNDIKVVSDLGPKLLAAMTALGMTPVSRGTKGGTPDVGPVVDALDELRKRRAEQRTG